MPKSGNKDKIRELYWNVMSHIINGNRINVIALIMDQLADLRLNMEMNLYFAPYIMSIIKVPSLASKGYVKASTLLSGHSRMTILFF